MRKKLNYIPKFKELKKKHENNASIYALYNKDMNFKESKKIVIFIERCLKKK